MRYLQSVRDGTWTDQGYDVASVEGVDVRPGADEVSAGPTDHRIDHKRALAGAVVLVVVLAAAIFAIYRQRESIADTFHEMGIWPVLLSGFLGVVGVAATFPIWRDVLAGLDVRMPWIAGSRVFFVSQLGKYVPGSIWPVLMQMEAGRARGASRRTMLAANLITLTLSCGVGLVLACLLLPLYDASALGRYWWLLLALPFLLALLHPRAMPAILDRLFALVHRPPLGERLRPRFLVRAVGWSLVSWLGLGAHLMVLCAALGHGGLSAFVLCTGGMALAYSAGVLFVPAPAGAGIRDVILALVLRTILDPGQALAVVIASRVILICCDLVLALAVVLTRVRRAPAAPQPS